jgi:5'-nucleotidase
MKNRSIFSYLYCQQLLFIVVLLFFLSALNGCVSNQTQNYTELTLLHTNDTHSQLESYTPFGEPEQGGVARRKSLIDSVRDEVGADRVLLVDAGDFSQGTIYYNVWHGAADIMTLNELGYDALTLGNHEMDRGPEKLERTLAGEDVKIADKIYETEELQVPLVVSNLDFSAYPPLQQRISSRLVVEKSGVQIGIVGVMTETISSISNLGDKVPVGAYLTSVQAEVDSLEAQGINKIVLLSHSSSAVDQQMAQQLSGVDVIVSGHDHALLLAPEDYAEGAAFEFLADQVQGAYPTVATAVDGHPLLIVSAFARGRVLGRVDLTFDDDGHISNWQSAPLLVDASIEADADISAKLSHYKEPLEVFSAAEIGHAGAYFDGSHNPGLRSQEMPLGNLVADAIYQGASSYVEVDAAIVNSGGIRASLPEDVDPQFDQYPYPVTFGQAMGVLPYGNTISILDVTGAELVATLDNAISWAYDTETGVVRSSGGFPQVSGLEITYCAARVSDMHAEASVLTPCTAALIDGGVVTSLQIAGNPVDLNASYRIAANTFLVGGGDYYSSFEQACQREDNYCVDTGILLLDAFVDEFQTNTTVVRELEGRIVAE